MDSIPQKRCTKCGEEKPATPEYFHRHKMGKHALNPVCKECRQKVRIRSNRKIERENRRLAGIKRCTKCKIDYPATSQYFWCDRNTQDGFSANCIECKRKYKAANPEKWSEYSARYSQINRVAIAARKRIANQRNRVQRAYNNRQRYLVKRDEILEKGRQAYQKDKAPYRAAKQRRRARERGLPALWNNADWLNCLEYWHNACAVCGGQLRDLFGNVEPHREHWIPLDYKGDDNPGTVPGNMLPLCSPCNLSKGSKMPEEWLYERYNRRKAKEILTRIQTYFDSL